MRKGLTDEQVAKEIEVLRQSYYVKLARKEQAIKYKERQKLYVLRNLEKRGKELESAGITMDILNARDYEVEEI